MTHRRVDKLDLLDQQQRTRMACGYTDYRQDTYDH